MVTKPPCVAETAYAGDDQRYRAIFESAVDFAVIATTRHGKITDWNPGAERIFGWPAAVMRGTPIGRIFTPEDQAQDRAGTEMARARTAGRASDERWHVRSDGSRFWASGEMTPLRDQHGTHCGFVKILHDRTRDRQAMEAQRADAEFLRGVLASSGDCIKVLDLDAALTFMSDGGQRIMEVSDFNAIRGCYWPDFWRGDGHVAAKAAVEAAKAGGVGHFQGPANTMAGTPKWWDVQVTPIPGADGRPEKLLSVSRDITDRKQGDERRLALLELGDRLRDLDDPEAMAFVAAEITGKTLAVDGAGYGTVDADAETVSVAHDWTMPGAPSIAGTHRFRDFGGTIETLKRGAIVLLNDTDPDAKTAAAFRPVGARAAINLPIFEQGRFVALFCLQQQHSRLWLREEIVFVRNVADRTRVAIGRLRAEAQLRDLAASLERQVAERTADRNRFWQLSSDIMVVVRPDGIMTAVNPAWTVALGWTEQDLVGRHFFTIVHPDDVEKTDRARKRLADGNVLMRYDNRIRHRDGSYRWIAWAAIPGDGVLSGVGRDFTAEKEQQEALERSEARLRSVFETSYQFQGLLTPEGNLLDANPTSLAAIGCRLDDVVGQKYWETPWFSATPGAPEQIRAAIPVAASGQVVRREIAINLPSGRGIFDFSLRPVFSARNEVIALVPEAMDLTERRQAEEQLRQSQKMEAVGQLTGGLAHDFNNLLTGITGSLEILQARLAKGRVDTAAHFISAALGAAGRAAALTHRLLAFSRRQTLDPKPTEANRLILDMEELLRRTVGPAVEVQAIIAPGLWTTLCDPNQLENALLNLCINARDAMPNGGRLVIETENRCVDERDARERDIAPGPYVAIRVTDTGSGMSPDIVARAFDPFFTTKPLGQGTGLGLSMIYGFARQSGGQVAIESKPGAGTTMQLYLPRYWGTAPAAQAEADLAAAPRAEAGETVLIVDDEPTVRMLVTEVLQELGYAALEAEEGATGLAVLRSDARIDLLITDVGLPGGMNGRQLADAARQLRPALKVLFITGYAEAAVAASGQLEAGMHVLTKPFAMEALASRIKAIIAGR
jgi:PAS domain S-box-containing protein